MENKISPALVLANDSVDWEGQVMDQMHSVLSALFCDPYPGRLDEVRTRVLALRSMLSASRVEKVGGDGS